MNHMPHHTPDKQFLFGVQQNGWIRTIAGQQSGLPGMFPQLLDSQLSIYSGNDNMAFPGINGTIHNQQITIVDAIVQHGIAGNFEKKTGIGVRQQVFVQVQRPFDMIIGRRRKSGWNA